MSDGLEEVAQEEDGKGEEEEDVDGQDKAVKPEGLAWQEGAGVRGKAQETVGGEGGGHRVRGGKGRRHGGFGEGPDGNPSSLTLSNMIQVRGGRCKV